ncbi:MAG: archease [Anaerolineae bacterium]|nr:archease [Anaerolineae bacterium]MDK1081439.1 archease [Anaerolineae bacterium]
MPFEEIPHTADWCLRVWADDLAGLLSESARGMNWLAGTKLANKPKVKHIFETTGPDGESLLVAFLSELVYFSEQENIGFDDFEIDIKDDRLTVEMHGAAQISVSKAIKAVTWHNIEIKETANGLEVEIVFDV